MFATKEDQRLYLPAWEYNAARVLGYIAEIVAEKGGEVKPWRNIMANNQSCEPDAEPMRIYGQSYITFILDDIYYSFDWNDNPFFDDHFTKTPVKDGKRLRNVYADSHLPPWKDNCLFKIATDLQCRCIAEVLFQNMIDAKYSDVYHETRRVKVKNTYNDRYHWEVYTDHKDEYVEVKDRWWN